MATKADWVTVEEKGLGLGTRRRLVNYQPFVNVVTRQGCPTVVGNRFAVYAICDDGQEELVCLDHTLRAAAERAISQISDWSTDHLRGLRSAYVSELVVLSPLGNGEMVVEWVPCVSVGHRLSWIKRRRLIRAN